jgi:hypothetical protein
MLIPQDFRKGRQGRKGKEMVMVVEGKEDDDMKKKINDEGCCYFFMQDDSKSCGQILGRGY